MNTINSLTYLMRFIKKSHELIQEGGEESKKSVEDESSEEFLKTQLSEIFIRLNTIMILDKPF